MTDTVVGNRTPISRTTLQRGDERVSETIVREVADAEGVDPTALPPLYGAIEVDALEALFAHAGASDRVTVGFRFAGYCVHVDDGDVLVFED